MSYLQPVKRRVKKTYLTPDEAIVKVNKIAEEANEKLRTAYALRDYWYSLAEELGEELRLAAVENNELREQLKTFEMLKKEVIELRERLSRVKSKAQKEREEEYDMERQKRSRR